MNAKANRLVGRAGLKLEAALDRFDLGRAVAGARAIDVGASTGGFTQVLLDRGAVHVVSVDAGHDQLHERLRGDARVTSLEKTDWKRLSLSEAPGPFDFFTVDVSFVAARNMLRGLAFRLRAGAAGVVLVKPQFELPDRLVRGGDVADPGLRQQATRRFTEKAESLGFRVLAQDDSPVAGSSGTVEILTHLVFDGRSERLPRPGETRASRAPAGKSKRASHAPPLDGQLAWFAVVAPGLEDMAAREVAQLPGVVDAAAVPGGVTFAGPIDVGMRANLALRIPTRILLRLGDVKAREFGKLRHQLARLPWDSVLPAGPVRISASATRSRLYHTGAIDESVQAAIGDRRGTPPELVAKSAAVEASLILIRGVEDRFTVSVDSSGDRLHRRGWRTESGEAPLRETLAAALLAFCGWQPGQALVDPMCGAGTIPIEACLIALGVAPGRDRGFAFERWPGIDAQARTRWSDLRLASEGARRDRLDAPIVAGDSDADAVAVAQRNAARAGVAEHLRVIEQPLRNAEPPAPSGLFIANPPYGARLGDRRDLPRLYGEIGRVLRARFKGWNAGVVVADARLASAFRLPVVASHAIGHGGLRVTLLRFAP